MSREYYDALTEAELATRKVRQIAEKLGRGAEKEDLESSIKLFSDFKETVAEEMAGNMSLGENLERAHLKEQQEIEARDREGQQVG